MSSLTSPQDPQLEIRADAVIIGAGISGLVAAYHLKRLGVDVLVLEKSDRAGGVIETLKIDGYLVERGPNSIRGTREFLNLIDALGLRSELATGDPKLPAYTYSRGALRAVPLSPPAALGSSLISTRAKLRILKEPFIPRRNDMADESIASFIGRRLGPEVLDELVGPFISGIYAGDPERLSIGACFPALAALEKESGSIVGGMFRRLREPRDTRLAPKTESLRPYRLCSFRGGLSTLSDALAGNLGDAVRYRVEIEHLTRERSEEGHVFRIDATLGEMRRQFSARSLIIATPASPAASIVKGIAPTLSGLLERVPYNSLVSVPLGCSTQTLPRLSGFGFLAARSAGLRTLGSVWNSSAFAGRAPHGYSLLTSFIGGTTDPRAVDLSDEALLNTVSGDMENVFRRTLKAKALPVTRYRAAIPQYELGHSMLASRIEAEAATIHGLELAGNYLRGVSLGDCIRNALATAEKVEKAQRERHTST
jgi:protoporphyrinogen/coproporphyrinogen III oxidase